MNSKEKLKSREKLSEVEHGSNYQVTKSALKNAILEFLFSVFNLDSCSARDFTRNSQ